MPITLPPFDQNLDKPTTITLTIQVNFQTSEHPYCLVEILQNVAERIKRGCEVHNSWMRYLDSPLRDSRFRHKIGVVKAKVE